MKISYRLVEILLRYLSFCQFDGGGYINSIFPDLQLFQLFPTAVAQNDPQWPILPPKWLKLVLNGQFWSIFNFSQVFLQKAAHIDSEWPNFTQFTTFPIFSHQIGSFPAKSLFFWGSTLAKFPQICNFFNCFQLQ